MDQCNDYHILLGEHFFRHSYGKVVAMLVRIFGLKQIEIAEDIVHDTLLEAMEQWSASGIPKNPMGWLVDVAKKKTINLLRRDQLFQSKISIEVHALISQLSSEETDKDDTLQMIFACCHPALPAESQIALALKTLCGLSIAEIADNLMTSEDNIHKRLYRAKLKFRQGQINLQFPEKEKSDRLKSVLQVLYLLFNQGYFSPHHSKKIRLDLCFEAIRLLMQVDLVLPKVAGVKGLLALMHLSVARFESRIDELGETILLEDQDRKKWDRSLIAVGMQHLSQSIELNETSAYQLEAGIIAEHCLAPDLANTNWKSIHSQYQILERLNPQPNITLNKAIALHYTGQEQEAFSILETLEKEPSIKSKALFHLIRAVLLKKSGYTIEAKTVFDRALSLSKSQNERQLILDRMEKS